MLYLINKYPNHDPYILAAIATEFQYYARRENVMSPRTKKILEAYVKTRDNPEENKNMVSITYDFRGMPKDKAKYKRDYKRKKCFWPWSAIEKFNEIVDTGYFNNVNVVREKVGRFESAIIALKKLKQKIIPAKPVEIQTKGTEKVGEFRRKIAEDTPESAKLSPQIDCLMGGGKQKPHDEEPEIEV